MLNLRLK
jgi:DNA-binding MurR/RpiR family transcriptional regulator